MTDDATISVHRRRDLTEALRYLSKVASGVARSGIVEYKVIIVDDRSTIIVAAGALLCRSFNPDALTTVYHCTEWNLVAGCWPLRDDIKSSSSLVITDRQGTMPLRIERIE